MTITKETIRDILIENELIDEHSIFLARGRYPAVYCEDIYEGCLNTIIVATEYGINNGFDKVKSDLLALVKVAVDLTNLDSTNSTKTIKQRWKLDEDAKKRKSNITDYLQERAKVALGLHPIFSLKISKKVLECVESTCANHSVYIKEIESFTEEQYNLLGNYHELTSSFEDWKSNNLQVMCDANQILNEITTCLANVLDDSSKTSLDSAKIIVNLLRCWRDKIAYSYLFFDMDWLNYLKQAKNAAGIWVERHTGVSKSNPRETKENAEQLQALWINDQMAEYIAHFDKS